jgi:hypothetical protein
MRCLYQCTLAPDGGCTPLCDSSHFGGDSSAATQQWNSVAASADGTVLVAAPWFGTGGASCGGGAAAAASSTPPSFLPRKSRQGKITIPAQYDGAYETCGPTGWHPIQLEYAAGVLTVVDTWAASTGGARRLSEIGDSCPQPWAQPAKPTSVPTWAATLSAIAGAFALLVVLAVVAQLRSRKASVQLLKKPAAAPVGLSAADTEVSGREPEASARSERARVATLFTLSYPH